MKHLLIPANFISIALIAVLSFLFVSCTKKQTKGTSYLTAEKTAVFMPAGFDSLDFVPSVALVKTLDKASEIPQNWTLRPVFSTVNTPYATMSRLNNDGSVPMRYRAKISGLEGVDFYGTGEQTGDLKRNGTIVPLYNNDNYMWSKGRMYQSMPFVMGVRPDGTAFGVIADATSRGEISLKDGAITMDFENHPFKVYIFEEANPTDVVNHLAELVGHMQLPPKWALGYQQSRYSYMSEKEGKDIMRTFRKKKIPCDVIWFDIDYMDGFRIFTFNNKTFPNPKRLNDFAHSIHFKTVYMIDPGVKVDKGYSVYDQLVANKGYVLNKKPVVGEKDQDASTSLAVQVSATSSQSEVNQPLAMIDNDHATYWLSNISDKHPAVIVDLGANSEILNIGIEWHSIHFPVDYTIETSNDKTSWKLFNSIKNQKTGGFVEVPYKEQTQARYVRISSSKFAKKANEQIGIHEIMLNGDPVNYDNPDIPDDMAGGRVWPGMCAFPDFTQPVTQEWWAGLCKDFMSTNEIDGMWNDMNEPAVFGGGALFTLLDRAWHPAGYQTVNGVLPAGPHSQYHNVYGMMMVEASRKGIQEANPDKRPFVLSRANYLGGHRYAATWTGDIAASEAHMKMTTPMCINIGLSGQPFIGPDSGGYAGDTTPELFEEWMAISPFYPFMRGHTGKGHNRKEPWSFGPKIEKTLRIAFERRYRLLPYIYTTFEMASRTGLPVMRPLFMTYPKDADFRNEHDYFMLGGDILVKPNWTDKHYKQLEAWKPFSLVKGDTAKVNPTTFLRPGAALAVGPVMQYTDEKTLEKITLYVNFDKNGQAIGTLYEDAGDGYGYKNGEYCRTTFIVTKGTNKNGYTVKTSYEGKAQTVVKDVDIVVLD